MPELAEVEHFRRRWDPGLGGKILRVELHGDKRIYRSVPVQAMQQRLVGSTLRHSEARGKQLLFRFSGDLWLGLHMGMTGRLHVAPVGFEAGKHDHLVLYQKQRALVFTDPRQFGRVRFAAGPAVPEWWARLPVAVDSPAFRAPAAEAFLRRHGRLSLKACLLQQGGFPGVGNWMADEILWRAGLDPRMPAGQLSQRQFAAFWKSLRWVCRGAIQHISPELGDPPKGWLFHERWGKKGRCPRHGQPLERATIGGRSTAWCPVCQPNVGRRVKTHDNSRSAKCHRSIQIDPPGVTSK